MHDFKPKPKSSFITPTSKTPVKRSSHAEIMAKLEKRAAYLQQDDLTAVSAVMQAYYQRKLAAAAQEQDLPAEEDSQKETQPSLAQEQEVKSIDVQQSSIPDTVQMKCAECGNEDNIQQQLDAQTTAQIQLSGQKPDIAEKSIQQIASIGFSDSPTTLPHLEPIQQSLGVNLSHVQAYIGGSAKVACQNIGAAAFASGDKIAFKETPSRGLASHEAAHIVQQQSGKVQLPGGVGQIDDEYERNADAVAARVEAGQSAKDLLTDYTHQSRQSEPQQTVKLPANQEQEHTHPSSPYPFHNAQSKDYNQGEQAKFQANKQLDEEELQGQELIAHNLTSVVQQDGGIQAKLIQNSSHLQGKSSVHSKTPTNSANTGKVAFVRAELLGLHQKPNQKSAILTRLPFGQRIYTIEDTNPQPSWTKISVLGKTGYVATAHIHFPPTNLIKDDPGLSLVRVKHGENFWHLVKKIYGINGNEGKPDQNINHFINAIRSVNKIEAFKVISGSISDKVLNPLVPGRDAARTELKENTDLWIPSFYRAANMNVGSGTVTGEVYHKLERVNKGIQDFKLACKIAIEHIPTTVANHVANTVAGTLKGLKDFAIDAVKILAASTSIGALIGASFGGVGAIPGAEIGFECGLAIVEVYGLTMLVETIFGMAHNLIHNLSQFINLVLTANGNHQKLEQAGKSLAEAIGILVDAILLSLVIYFSKEGSDALGKTKFAQTVGKQPLIKWLKDRQQFNRTSSPTPNNKVVIEQTIEEGHTLKVLENGEILLCSTCEPLSKVYAKELADPKNAELAHKLEELEKQAANTKLTNAEKEGVRKNLVRIEDTLRYIRLSKKTGLSKAATNAIVKLENLKQNTLGEINSQSKHNHYKAARLEADGKIVAKRGDGVPFDHIRELQEAYNGLRSVLKALEAEQENPPEHILPKGMNVLGAKIKEVRKLMDNLHGFLNEIGYGKFPPEHKWIPGKNPGTWVGNPSKNK